MPNYQDSKIYKLWSYQTDDVYYGSTCQKLSSRKAGHKRDYNDYLKGECTYITSFEICKYDDFMIELVEEYPCNNKMELERKEGEYIRNNKCVNKVIAGRTKKEWVKENKEKIQKYQKEFQEKNRDDLLIYKKEYYEKNKTSLNEKSKLWQETHKEIKKETDKKYADEHKEEIQKYKKEYYLKNKEYILCDCGNTYNKPNKIHHEKTKKHLNYVSSTKSASSIQELDLSE